MTRFSRTKSSVFNQSYHIVWTPKYRKPILHKYEKYIKKYIIIKAAQIKCSVALPTNEVGYGKYRYYARSYSYFHQMLY